MADLGAEYRAILKKDFDSRKEKNPRYSIRAYAKFLGADNGFLSKLFAGKVLLSLDLADKFTKRLKLDAQARAAFLISAAEEQKCHALYLIDPELSDCDPELEATNALPRRSKT